MIFGLRRENRSGISVFLVVFALIFVRYCCWGFEYYYQLDDYIQYHNYTSGGDSPFGVIMNLGMLAARPLAGCTDVLVWANFFSCMLLAVAVISAMYAASACIFKNIWERHFGTGYTFLAVYALLPLGLEGVYWVSASSRIVVGLFFAALSLKCFDEWCDNGAKLKLLLYIILQLISYGFYEQILAFSCAATVLVALLNRSEVRRRAIWCLFSLVNAGIYFGFVSMFPDSALYSEKTAYILPFSSYYWQQYFPYVFEQIKTAFVDAGFYVIAKGFKRGVLLLLQERNFIYTAAIAVLLYLFFRLARKDDGKSTRKPAAIIVGVLLALAPLAPFFVVENSWFSLRGTVASYCGLALAADAVISFLVSGTKKPGLMTAWFVTAVSFVFCVASVSEIYDYKETTRNDTEFTELLHTQLSNDKNISSEQNIAILNVEPSYLDNQNYYWHEHIHGVTESAWALTGALECHAGMKMPDVTPMPAHPMYRPWNYDVMQLELFDVLYLYTGDELVKLELIPDGDGWQLYDGNGEYLGYTWEEDNYAYLVLNG